MLQLTQKHKPHHQILMKPSFLKSLLAAAAFAAAGVLPSFGDNLGTSGTHALGNGRVCAYGKDADIQSIFGPVYSAPTLVSVTATETFEVRSSVDKCGGVWTHALSSGGQTAGTLSDCIPPTADAFVRSIDARTGTLSFTIGLLPENAAFRDHVSVRSAGLEGFTSSFIMEVTPGVPFYSAYESPSGYHVAILTKGGSDLEPVPGDAYSLGLRTLGKGSLYVVVSDSREGLDRQIALARRLSPRKAARQSRRWTSATRKELPVTGTGVLSPEDRADLDRTVRLVSDYVIAQQDEGGGILAGKNYHMAYVRDQYGNSRGLLAMGHVERARKLLDFYFRIWERFGCIHNAQPMGVEGAFHCHEDDNTEITGYLVVQAMDYYSASKDEAFIERIMPMLRWAVKVQQDDIIDDMLPFNGDETYIAGGLVPRDVMYHGSAEATLLFIEGTRRLARFLEEHPSKVWAESEISSMEKSAEACAAAYRDNFFIDGKLFLNNPDREKKVVYPETRPGVCLYPGAPTAHYPVTYHFKGNLYFCADCMKKDTTGIEPAAPKRYSIPSAYLFPVYIGSGLFTDDEKKALLDEVVRFYGRTGKIDERDIVLGYDWGLFLYALAEYGHPLAAEIYRKMMDLRDSSLSWVEYYVDGKPFNTPCRPWESSINIVSALKYAGGQPSLRAPVSGEKL